MSTSYGNDSKDKILHKLFRKSELSYAVSDLSKAIGPIIDLMFTSLFIGPAGVTVMGYVSPLIMLFEFIGTDISSGSRNKASSLLGAGNLDEVNKVFSASVASGGILSLTTALVVCVLCSSVSIILGAREPQVFEMTKQYIFGYIIGLPFFTLTRILTPYLQMEGQYLRVNAISILTTVVDLAADVFVIFVLHGGMFELALGTSLGYIVSFLVGAVFFLPHKKRSVFQFSFRGIDMKTCLETIYLGAPAGMVKGSNAVGGMLINNMLTAFNLPYFVAAYGVFSQLLVFIRSAWYAPADTLHAFAGIFIGEEDRVSLKEVHKISLTNALLYCCAVTAGLFIFAVPLARVFLKSNDPEALRMAVECIRISCFVVPFHAVVYNFNNYLMTVKRLRFCNIYSFLMECGSIVPITFFMLFLTGYRGAWISKVVSMFVLYIIAAVYVNRNGEGKTYQDKMLLLPESFGIPPENEIAVYASSTEEIVDLSRLAVAFAAEHGADRKKAKTFGLITEELAGVLTEHGFSDGRTHNINARLVAKGEELIIRMRDDCKPFNITEYYRMVRESHENDAGIAIIMKLSKSVTYTNALGTNNLIVKI